MISITMVEAESSHGSTHMGWKDAELHRQDSSQLTTNSSETDFTNATITTASSIKTVHPRKSASNASINPDNDLQHQYEQRPEKLPDIATEMEKWYALTDR